MDKQQDSISTVGVGKEYPPSEVYTAEPPPAYQRTRGTAVQIARIAAGTVIAVTFILGFFMLASAYITASASCANYNFQEALRQELEEQPQYQHLVAVDPLSEESGENKQENLVPPPPPPPAPAVPVQQDATAPIQLKLPLTLDFDDLAGSLVEKNQRSRMNCVVEKRRAEEVMDHQPKTVRLPFGVNLTTDPRYEHVTGERMAIFCESGHDQRHVPMDNNIGSPVVVPIPFHQEAMHLIPLPMPMHQGPVYPPPHGHGMGPPPPHMMPRHPQQLIHPPPPPMPMHPHPAQTQAQMGPPHPEIPMSILTRIAQEEAADSKDDEPLHIIAREEIIPVFHPASPEGRAMNGPAIPSVPAPVPAEMVQPPPPPPQYTRQLQMPQTTQLHPAQDQQPRPHFVQPRSVRSVDDTFLKREKRVKRCACDCSC
ncbi:E3 ubiquitin-protein ligase Hakai isoform X2 [Homalodisca vitripennis]|uniref:E3 ubiquitin-protein ligase Hakai isoform X2 n=1 Tax=Homalodisca vitripennis TaxID=197043 RepID=UPI001EEB28AC|nr:E3 ubiquitin-protein ligase Hakai isoform X2 [Homalodisca vitripennis]